MTCINHPKYKRGEAKRLVYELHLAGLQSSKIAEKLGINKITVWYHKKKLEKELGIKIIDNYLSRFKFKDIDLRLIQKDIDDGINLAVIRHKYGWNEGTLSRAFKRGVLTRPKLHKEMTIEELSILWDGKNGAPFRKTVRRKFIQKYGHRCMICGLSEWMGKPIPLEIDHIDGSVFNNKIDNLRMVCPNCHAQTPTYGGKNKMEERRSANGQAANLSSS